MKTLQKINLKSVLCWFIALLIPTAVLNAQLTAIQLTGSGWSTGTQVLGNNGSVMTGTNIQPGSNYTGPAFRGGAVATDTTIDNWEINNNGGSGAILGLDVFRLSIGTTANLAQNKFHHGAIFFDQSAFGNGLDSISGGVTLNNTTSLQYTAKRVSGNPSRIGFLLQANGSYFLHSIAYDDSQLGGGQGHQFTLADPTAVTWNTFTPETSLSTIGGVGAPDFTKVTGIGLWFENERVGSSTTGMDFRVGEITFTAVPEPSTYALILGVVVLGATFARRRYVRSKN